MLVGATAWREVETTRMVHWAISISNWAEFERAVNAVFGLSTAESQARLFAMLPDPKENAKVFVLRVEHECKALPVGLVDNDTLLHAFLPKLKRDFGRFMYHALINRQTQDLWTSTPSMTTWEGLVKGATKWTRTGR